MLMVNNYRLLSWRVSFSFITKENFTGTERTLEIKPRNVALRLNFIPARWLLSIEASSPLNRTWTDSSFLYTCSLCAAQTVCRYKNSTHSLTQSHPLYFLEINLQRRGREPALLRNTQTHMDSSVLLEKMHLNLISWLNASWDWKDVWSQSCVLWRWSLMSSCLYLSKCLILCF